MTQWLKQSTTVTVKIGPFLDATDGVTEETALSVAVELSKNGGAFAARNSATSITHDAEGWYAVELNATDTGTLGRLELKAQDSATHLPVFVSYMVVPANVWDSMFGSDTLQVDLVQMGGAAQSATDLKDFADAGYDPTTNKVEGVKTVDTTTTNTDMRGTDNAMLAASAPTNFGDLAITATTGKVTVGTNDDKTGYSISGSKTTLDALNDIAVADIYSDAKSGILDTGTAQAVSASSITLASGHGFATDEIAGAIVVILTASTGDGQTREITALAGDVATVSPNWTTTPTGTVTYMVLAAPPSTTTTENRLAELDAANLPADIDAILADTADMQPKLGTPAADVSADIAAVKSQTAAIETDTQDIQTQIGTAGAGLTNLGGMSTSMKGEVNAEVVDALGTDTIAEMSQGAPPATPTLKQAIMYLYMKLRNKVTVTSSQATIANDSGTTIAKATLSDDGSTFTKSEYVSGP